jgi:hypothetical protein
MDNASPQVSASLPDAPDSFLTQREVCSRLGGVSVDLVQRLRYAGELTYIIVGTGSQKPKVRISEKSLNQFIARRTVAAKQQQ